MEERTTPFPKLLHFTLNTYLILPSVKQGGISTIFKVSGMTRPGIETQVSRTIDELSTHYANEPVKPAQWKKYIYVNTNQKCNHTFCLCLIYSLYTVVVTLPIQSLSNDTETCNTVINGLVVSQLFSIQYLAQGFSFNTGGRLTTFSNCSQTLFGPLFGSLSEMLKTPAYIESGIQLARVWLEMLFAL